MAEMRCLLPISEIPDMAKRNSLLKNAGGGGARLPHRLNDPPERARIRLLWRDLLKIELEILQQSLKIQLDTSEGMTKDGRYGHRRLPEIDCISAQIQQAKILRVRIAVESISRA